MNQAEATNLGNMLYGEGNFEIKRTIGGGTEIPGPAGAASTQPFFIYYPVPHKTE